MENLKETQEKILQWAAEKGIFEKATVSTQFHKLIEEVLELNVEIRKNDKEATLLEFGDVLVVLTILAKQLDTDFETCLSMAYNKIKNRTGKMENGYLIETRYNGVIELYSAGIKRIIYEKAD